MAWQNISIRLTVVEWPTFHWVLTQPLSSMKWLNIFFILPRQVSVFLSSPVSSVKSPDALPSQCGIMGNPYRRPHSGPPCPSFQKRFIFHFCAHTCDSVCLCKQTYATRKIKDQTGAFWVTKHWPLSSWHRKTVKDFESIPSCERLSFCVPNSRKGLVWHAWRSCLFRNLHLSYHLFSPSMQMDNKAWNGQKASFTEATSNSEYQHVSLCSLSISFPFSSPALHRSAYAAGGFSHRDRPPFNLCDWSIGLWLSA